MKRKFLLAIIPALLAISACGVKPSTKVAPIIEDNVAHEEIYGEAQEFGQLQVKKADRVAPLEPKIGIQYKRDGDKISLRYVAAISTLSVKAKWYRGLAMQDSNCPLKIYDNGAYVIKESTTAYKAVGNGDGNIIEPYSVGNGYQYFVVYTLRNIDYETYKYSYIGAYLELTDDEDNVLVTSDVVVSCVDQQNYFSFAKNDYNGYFIEGTIGGQAKQFREINDTPSGSNNAEEAGLVLSANDNFGLFKWTSQEFKYFGRYNFGRNESFYSEDSSVVSTNFSKVRAAGTYTLYVNQYNEYNLSPEHISVDIYLNVGIWETENDNERYAVYAYKDDDHHVWYDMESTATANRYKCTYDFVAYPYLIFCRMNGNKNVNVWNDVEPNNVWNQTSNITFSYNASSVLDIMGNNVFSITGWNQGDWGRP